MEKEKFGVAVDDGLLIARQRPNKIIDMMYSRRRANQPRDLNMRLF